MYLRVRAYMSVLVSKRAREGGRKAGRKGASESERVKVSQYRVGERVAGLGSE